MVRTSVELESRSAEYLDVRECVAVASCTAGLMLLLRAAGLTGDVVIPSFTFAATAHAVAWNGLQPVFADVDPSTLTLSPEAVRRSMGVRTSAILATHIFGTPCEVEVLEDLAARDGIQSVLRRCSCLRIASTRRPTSVASATERSSACRPPRSWWPGKAGSSRPTTRRSPSDAGSVATTATPATTTAGSSA